VPLKILSAIAGVGAIVGGDATIVLTGNGPVRVRNLDDSHYYHVSISLMHFILGIVMNKHVKVYNLCFFHFIFSLCMTAAAAAARNTRNFIA